MPSEILFFELISTAPPRLVVGTKDALLGVDAADGKVLWSRADIRKVTARQFDVVDTGATEPGRGGRGVAIAGDTLHIFDLETGTKVSDSTSWSVRNACCFLPVIGNADGLVLVVARADNTENVLLAVDSQSGAVRWRRELLFKEQLSLAQLSGYSVTLFGNQLPLQADEANLLLYVSRDGPIDLDPAKGTLRWRGSSLKRQDVPLVNAGFAPMQVHGEVVYIPSEHTLAALNLREGTPVWISSAKLPGQVVQMEWTAHGLLVGGSQADADGNLGRKPFLDLLDPATGRSRWPSLPTHLKDSSRFTAVGDTAYVATNDKLVAVDLAGGPAKDIASVTFEGREHPEFVEVRPEGMLLVSDHNLVLLGSDGTPKYERYYPGPHMSRLATIGRVLTSRPGEDLAHALGRGLATRRPVLGVTGVGRDFVYIVATAPDAGGHQGVSLVRVDKTDGAEAGRVALTAGFLDYETDPATDVVYLQQGPQVIAAVRFAAGESAPPH